MSENKKITRKIVLNFMANIVVILTIFAINIVFVSAQTPTPRGIEGKVFHLDGNTEVFSNFPIRVENLDTGDYLIGYTGKGSSGRYSFVLNWGVGDEIKVIAQNPFFEDSITIELEGSIRNADLFLDMDFENLPPNITSTPIVEAVSNFLYEYQVTSFDWNGDEITYSISSFPENMSINESTGLISWIPTREQFGTHIVTINASDGEYYDLQNFSLEVFTDKDAPLILSEPITSVMRNEKYEYEVIVDDEEEEYDFLTYEVFRGPEGMYFNNNILTFEMNGTHSGEYIIILDIKDRFNLIARQIFILRIDELPTTRKSTLREEVIIEKEATTLYEKILSIKEFLFKTTPIKKILIANEQEEIEIRIREINPLDEKLKTTKTRSYAYILIEPSKQISEEVIIEFFVSSDWLNRNGILKEDVVLLKFVEDAWIELETIMLDEENLLFSAKSPGLSYFAISHKDTQTEFPREIDVNKIDPIFLLIGDVHVEKTSNLELSDFEVQELINNLEIRLINTRTDEVQNANLVYSNNKIKYQVSISGRLNDEVELIVKIKDFESVELISLKKAIDEHNIYLNYDDLNLKNPRSVYAKIILVIALLIILLVSIKIILAYKNKTNFMKKTKKKQ
jgi:PGF-pre-PGF domain-containing protein